MLSADIINALKSYTQSMRHDVCFVVAKGEHNKKDELMQFLQAVASVNDRLQVEERADSSLRSPISFFLEKDGTDTGVRFSGIPSGHEFNSLVLAILHASGTQMKLDQGLQQMVQRIDESLHFEVFISLSCHNCPDVVQALNQFALLNEHINTEMLDGGLFPELIAERDIQGVPSVYLNGELFANGKITASDLMDRLVDRYPSLVQQAEQADMPLQDVVVIGGGPAGVSSAIYSARKGLKVTLIADRLGGQVKDTMGIENLISVTKTTGPELTANLHQHVKEYDITVKEQVRVTEVVQGDIKQVKLSSGELIETQSIIVATGAKWRELGVPGEKENIGNGVAYCPHCDGPFFKGKDVVVVGGGNSGIEAALDLAGIVKSVTVIEFLPELKADKVLVDQAQARNNITLIKNAATQEIIAEQGRVTGVVYQNRDTQQTERVAVEGVFIQIGLVPNSAFLNGLLEQTQYGELVINEKCETSAAGIYACGDVTTVPYKQIVVAMGEGAKASLAAFEYLLANSDRLQQLHHNTAKSSLMDQEVA
jgi:alkyl hydroperoxide reductase subunit F